MAQRGQQRRLEFSAASNDLRFFALLEENHGLVRASAHLGGEVAGNNADGQQRKQCHPVLGVGDRECSDRRQKEVETDEGHERCRNGHPECRNRGHDQDDEQEQKSDGRRVRDGEPHEEGRQETDG